MKKYVLLTLIVLSLALIFVACNQTPEGDPETTTAAATTEAVTEAATETTAQPTTEAVTEEPTTQKGCASFAGTTAAGLFLLAVAAALLTRKKEE